LDFRRFPDQDRRYRVRVGSGQILSTAKDLKYTREVLRLLTAEWTDPSEAFVLP